MTEEQLKQAAHELAATCESLGADFEIDVLDEYLTRLGFNAESFKPSSRPIGDSTRSIARNSASPEPLKLCRKRIRKQFLFYS